jgi:hypothetical protein
VVLSLYREALRPLGTSQGVVTAAAPTSPQQAQPMESSEAPQRTGLANQPMAPAAGIAHVGNCQAGAGRLMRCLEKNETNRVCASFRLSHLTRCPSPA